MKLTKIILRDNNVPASLKLSVVVTALGYGKIYELLHKQIWRKAPYRILRYANPLYTHHNGRPVEFILGWNIKSPQTGPYSYEGGDHTFGLNQLLMGQDFRKPYVGNPKDGIYHDDCYIEPKHIPATIDGYYDVFAYYTDSFIDYEQNFSTSYTLSQTWDKQDEKGKVLINNVSLVEYSTTAEPIAPATVGVTTHYKKIVIDKVVGDDVIIELGNYDPLLPKTDGILLGKTDSLSGQFGYRKWMNNDKDEFTEHGNIVTQINTQPIFSLTTLSLVSGWIRVYADNTVIEYVPESTEQMGDDSGIIPSHYKILPMMYTDTGDLTMDRVEFVEKWNDYFDLIVHEDKEWWQMLIRPILAIIVIVVACYTGLNLSPALQSIVMVGGFISAAGILTGNKMLSLVGGVLMAGASIYNAIEEGYGTSLMKSGVFPDRAEVLIQNASFSEMFKGFTSNAGLSNLSQIGSKVFSIGNDISQFGNSTIDQSSSIQTKDEHMKISFFNSEDDDDVLGCIKKVIAL